MHISTLFAFVGVASAAAVTTSCNANNCLRQVRASAFPSRSTSADCAAYQTTTVTPYTTTTVTSTGAVAGLGQPSPAPTPAAHTIPKYASSCDNDAEYRSACACNGITSSSTQVPTSTLTATSTVTPILPSCTVFKVNLRGTDEYFSNFGNGMLPGPLIYADTFDILSSGILQQDGAAVYVHASAELLDLQPYLDDNTLRCSVIGAAQDITCTDAGVAIAFYTRGAENFRVFPLTNPPPAADGFTQVFPQAISQC